VKTDKLDPILLDLATKIQAGFLQDTFVVEGKRWTLKTLNEEESTWRDLRTDMTTALALTTSRRAPTLAIATVAVDSKSTVDLFSGAWNDLDKDLRGLIEMQHDGEGRRFWAAEQLLDYLRRLTPSFLNQLQTVYTALIERQTNADAAIKGTLDKEGPTAGPVTGP
jgi:hypothetical protein